MAEEQIDWREEARKKLEEYNKIGRRIQERAVKAMKEKAIISEEKK